MSEPKEKSNPAWTGAIFGAILAGLLVGGVLVTMMWNHRRIYLNTLAEQNKRLRDAQMAMASLAPDFKRLQGIDAARGIFAALAAKDARLYRLDSTPAQPDARGHVLFDPATTRYHLVAANLRAPAENRTYRLWLIDAYGPAPAGELRLDADGGVITTATPTRPITATELLVTEEPTPSPAAPQGPVQLRCRF